MHGQVGHGQAQKIPPPPPPTKVVPNTYSVKQSTFLEEE